jgi:hypothetical protein
MERSKFIAYLTGIISVILALGYLILVSLLDFRGEMIPAPMDEMMILINIQKLVSTVFCASF